MKITQRGIEALLRKGHERQTDYSDSITRGLAFRIGPRSAAWYYFRRVDGALYRLRLGKWPEMTIKAARDEVGAIEAAIESGEHPKARQARQESAKTHSRQVDQARLFENVSSAWSDHHLPEVADQTAAMYGRAIRRLNDEFAGRDISTITRGELVRFLDKIKAASKSGVPANHAAATIRLLFAYALDRLDLAGNPADGLKNPAKVKARDRILDRRELRIVWKACELAGYPFGHALRFQICTGQRIGEVGGIRRDDVDGEFWRLSRNKTGKRIDVYLAGHARAILEDCPDFGTGAPYFSASGGKAGLRADGFHLALKRHIRKRLDQAAVDLELKAKDDELPAIADHWTPHDLRRTVRSGLTGWCGVFPDIAERTINHAVGGLRAVYDHADYRPHIADALQRWDAELGRILDGEQAAVTQIRRESA